MNIYTFAPRSVELRCIKPVLAGDAYARCGQRLTTAFQPWRRKVVKSINQETDGYEEVQNIGFFKQAETGMPGKKLCRQGRFSDSRFYKRRAKFGGMQATDAKRLGELESENSIKCLLAEVHPGHSRTQGWLWCKALAPQARRAAAAQMIAEHHLSERRACRLVGLSSDCYRNPPLVDERTQLLSAKIVEIAQVRRRSGYRRIHDLLRPGLPGVNHKRVYQLYS